MGKIEQTIEGFSQVGKRALQRGQRLWRMATSPLRSLPDIVIVGAMKAGTTSLYHYLCQHPNVSGAWSKEVHYFDENYGRNPLWYRSNFDLQGRGISIEATPRYLFDEETLWRMSVLLPDAIVIALLREPVSRAYSHYKHVRRGMGKWGTDHRSFQEAARADIEQAEEKGALGTNRYEDVYHSYIRRGIYKPQIERFKRVYGENLVVVKSEDMFNDAKRVVNKIFDRAGLKGIDLRKERVHKEGSYDKKIEIKDDLETFFSPYNEELYDLLETEKWWRY
jgi:hypothetical protein